MTLLIWLPTLKRWYQIIGSDTVITVATVVQYRFSHFCAHRCKTVVFHTGERWRAHFLHTQELSKQFVLLLPSTFCSEILTRACAILYGIGTRASPFQRSFVSHSWFAVTSEPNFTSSIDDVFYWKSLWLRWPWRLSRPNVLQCSLLESKFWCLSIDSSASLLGASC